MTPSTDPGTVRTTRLTLEPQTAHHADEMFAALADPAIYRFENEPPPSVEWLRARFARLESRRSADGTEQWFNWIVRRIDCGAAIGYVQATLRADATALIAYEFNSAHWGMGYAREAVEAMLRELGTRHRVAVAGAVFKRTNVRSRHLLERLGMREAGGAFPARLAAADEDALAMRLADG